MNVIGLTGWSGSGKTTLLVELVVCITSLGYTVSTIKHAHHNFDVDQKGKDSFLHRKAGASEVLVASSNRWALMHELRTETEPDLEHLLTRMSPVDIVLVEGYKNFDHKKIEVHRPDLGHPLIALEQNSVIAIATDKKILDATKLDTKILDLNDVMSITNFILSFCGLSSHKNQLAKDLS
ncbi:MAG: molybdopterin-guanine dinucleotide biosynthesis protein B [Alphaproteobacteria bacterium]|nr:molybdopterin-guanine dinucleotide biosynthesis protein B [Alphaproteobacteria bacterium]|tara:strand:+ start:61 stop:600 length:540 start_codon:yes stop_codon:yes gene_type:complete